MLRSVSELLHGPLRRRGPLDDEDRLDFRGRTHPEGGRGCEYAVEEDAIRALRPGGPGRWEWPHLPDDLARQAAQNYLRKLETRRRTSGSRPSCRPISRSRNGLKSPSSPLQPTRSRRSRRGTERTTGVETITTSNCPVQEFVGTESRGVPCGRKRPNRDRTWCGTVHIDGDRCGRRLGPWSLGDGDVRLFGRSSRERPRQGSWPSVWRPADGPDRSEERYLQASDLSDDTYPPTCSWALRRL